MLSRGQGEPPRPPDREDVVDRFHSAAVHLLRVVRTADQEMGLTPARASVLSVLVFGGPRTVGGLARAEAVRSPTMTALVSGLEADGFVRRRASDRDGREVMVEATAKGTRLLRRGRARRVALLASLVEDLEVDDLAVLDRAAAVIDAALSSRLAAATGD